MSDRRLFLSELASLPLGGGSVELIGQPKAAAVPITQDLMQSYKNWLYMEHRMLSFELAGHCINKALKLECAFQSTITDSWHFQWKGRGPAGWIDAPQPSTRAAVVLSAAGVPLIPVSARGKA